MTSIELTGGDAGYRPGETLTGTVSWSLPEAPTGLELRLAWWTEGKGTQDGLVVETRALEDVRAGRSEFSFTLPASPWSWSGRLVSIVWGLELVAARLGSLDLLRIQVGPEGCELTAEELGPVEQP